MFGGLNFKLCFCQNGTGLPGNFLTWCRFWAKFYEFHYLCAWKIALHTWHGEKLPRTAHSDRARSLVLEERVSLRTFMIMGQFRKTIPRILRIRHHQCLEHFELFLPRTWTSQSFLLMYQKSFSVFLLRGNLWLKLLASHMRHSIRFFSEAFLQWILHVKIKLTLCRNATGLPGEILKCNSV